MKVLCLVIFCGLFLLPALSANDEESERSLSRQKRALVYPQYTVLQITMCIISQISSLTSHRVAINAGFNINYGLPFQLKNFYNPMYWARSLSNVSSPFTNFFEKLAENNERDDEDESGESYSEDEDNEKNIVSKESSDNDEDLKDETTTEIETTTTTEKPKRKRKPKVKRDLSAGEFYYGLKELMSYSGYHGDCMLKSVCELAHHPIHHDDDNFANDMVHFILTPSLHQAFDLETEAHEKMLYEKAEEIGKAGGDCELLYGKNCESSPLHKISKFIHHDSNDI